MRAAVYARVSTTRQAQAQTIEQQLDRLRTEVARRLKHLSFPDRAMASAVRAAEGDFRNWAEIRAWAASIASALQSR